MKNQTKNTLLIWGVFLLCAASYIALIFNQNVWMDEAFTASLIRTDFLGVIDRSMHDTLPPLYNIYLKLMTDIFGYRIPIMKLSSVIPMLLTMVLAATVVNRRHGLRTAVLYLLSLTMMPCMQYFGVEIRMYSMGFFFATASGIYAYEVLAESNRKNWCAFTLFSVLAGYSHHFAFVTVGFVYLFLLLYYFFADRTHIKRWFICLGATFLLYLPCMLVTLKQLKRVNGYFSMPEVTLSVFAKYACYPYITGVTVLTLLLILAVAALAVFTLIRTLKGKELVHIYALSCLVIYYGVLVFGTIVSKIMTANIFVDRYLFFAFGLVWLFFSIEAAHLPDLTLGKSSPAGITIPTVCLGILFELVIGLATLPAEFITEYAVDPAPLLNCLEQVQEGEGLVTYDDTEALYYCMTFYQPNFKYYGSEDAAFASDCDHIYYAVSHDYSLSPSIPDSAEYLGDFIFDRYGLTLYKYDLASAKTN